MNQISLHNSFDITKKRSLIRVSSDQLLNALIFDTEGTLPRIFLTPGLLSWS